MLHVNEVERLVYIIHYLELLLVMYFSSGGFNIFFHFYFIFIVFLSHSGVGLGIMIRLLYCDLNVTRSKHRNTSLRAGDKAVHIQPSLDTLMAGASGCPLFLFSFSSISLEPSHDAIKYLFWFALAAIQLEWQIIESSIVVRAKDSLMFHSMQLLKSMLIKQQKSQLGLLSYNACMQSSARTWKGCLYWQTWSKSILIMRGEHH